MELQEFISTTLQQIINGVKDAQDKLQDVGVAVGPVVQSTIPKLSERTEIVHFDVAVTVSETSGTQGGGGIRVFSFFSADGSISKAAETACVSRITFDIPTALPPMKYRDPKPSDTTQA